MVPNTEQQLTGRYMENNYKGLININYDKDNLLTDYAKDMIMDFYAIKGETSPQEVYARAACAWSTFKGKQDLALAQRLYNYVSNKWFMFASPVLSNAPAVDAKAKGLPISCFLTYVPDTVEGLIDHSSELRWLSVMGGGVGGHWSDVRSVSDVAPGPIPFLHTVDADMTAYRQGKTRKGSYAAYLSIDHPDIMEFIGLRIPTGDVNRKCFNLHNAVNITNTFMDAVLKGKQYELIDPKRGNTGEFLDARTVWTKLMETRFRTGEPYLNFIDTANEALPQSLKDKGLKIHGSNLCNEIHLPTSEDRTAVCCLSSVNLEYFSEWKETTMVQDLVRMLDNVLEYFIDNAPASLVRAVKSAKAERSIGLGAMGFHECLQRYNISFESTDAVFMNETMFSFIKTAAKLESKQLATERGEPEDMAGTGLRHAHLMAIAPNASSGILLSTSPSIEPSKANAYTHRTRAGSFLVKNKYLDKLLNELGKNNEETWSSIITNKGSVQHLNFLSDEQKKVYKTSFELDQAWVVKHAADRQPFICQGQSVNLFFPAGSDRSYVNKVHLQAWLSGLKGLYYLRTEAKQRAENVSEKVEENKLKEVKETIIYGKPNCPQCNMAKALLESRGIEYVYVDITTTGKSAAEITGRSDVRTLPQVYLNGEYVGGFDGLYSKLQHRDTDAVTEDNECKACEG
jgi:ribonucleoside-diphosphate reductase alpha chain